MRSYAAHQKIFLGISGVLFVAILPIPPPFYTATNLFIALSGGLLVWIAWKSGRYLWVVPGVAAFFLYLPAFNQPFDKSTWVILDLIFIGVFLSAALTLKGDVLEGKET